MAFAPKPKTTKAASSGKSYTGGSIQAAKDADAGTTTESRQPIGVGADYKPPPGPADKVLSMLRINAPVQTRNVLYYTNDDWRVQAAFSPEQRAGVQDTLHSLGLLGKYTRGAWDNSSASAFKEVLAYANSQGVTWQRALGQMVDAGGKFGQGGGAALAPKPAIRLTSTDDLRRVFREGAKAIYGSGNLDPTQIDQMIADFHARERGFQQRTQQGGGEVEEPPSADTFVEQELTKRDPGKADARKVIGGLREAFQFIGGATDG